MPQLSPLVLKDRETTPNEYEFLPQDIVDNVGTVALSPDGVPLGTARVSLSLRRTKDVGNYRAQMRFSYPVLADEVINGVTVPKVARTHYADLTMTFAATSTEAERNAFVGMIESALWSNNPDSALVNDVFVKLQGVY